MLNKHWKWYKKLSLPISYFQLAFLLSILHQHKPKYFNLKFTFYFCSKTSGGKKLRSQEIMNIIWKNRIWTHFRKFTSRIFFVSSSPSSSSNCLSRADSCTHVRAHAHTHLFAIEFWIDLWIRKHVHILITWNRNAQKEYGESGKSEIGNVVFSHLSCSKSPMNLFTVAFQCSLEVAEPT